MIDHDAWTSGGRRAVIRVGAARQRKQNIRPPRISLSFFGDGFEIAISEKGPPKTDHGPLPIIG